MADEPTLAQRWAADTGTLDVAGRARYSRRPQGAVHAAVLTDTDTQRPVGLVWTDAQGIGYTPAADGSPAAMSALSYAWGVLSTHGVDALRAEDAFSPGYRLGDPVRYPSIRDAYSALIR